MFIQKILQNCAKWVKTDFDLNDFGIIYNKKNYLISQKESFAKLANMHLICVQME